MGSGRLHADDQKSGRHAHLQTRPVTIRPGLLFGAVVAAGLAGAAVGVIGTHALIGSLPFSGSPVRNGWSAFPLPVASPANAIAGAFARAARAQRNPSAFPASQAQSYLCQSDGDGRGLTGASRYVVRFARTDLPSLDTHWTLAVLNEDETTIDDGRAALSGNATDLHRNADGSVEIAVQATPPDDPVANWLATPTGRFRLVMRLYPFAAAPEVGDRPLPAVMRRETAA